MSSDLYERLSGGELDAFETVFRQSHREVYGWIVRIVRDGSIAEDLTMETFERIYSALGRFDPTRPFGAWARRIATHVAIDHLKSLRHEVELPLAVSNPSRTNPAWEREAWEAFAVLPVIAVVYYLAWKHVVAFFNDLVGGEVVERD